MSDDRQFTPTSDASVVGASEHDRASTVNGFFAAFPFDGAAPPLDRLPATSFFDVLLAENG